MVDLFLVCVVDEKFFFFRYYVYDIVLSWIVVYSLNLIIFDVYV